jgi:TrmH family RNA methyltransferase
MPRISSRQNALVSKYRSVAAGEEHGLLLLDGVHLVADALAAQVPLTHAVVAADAAANGEIRELIAQAERAGAAVVTATAPVMRAVSPVRSASPIVALAARPKTGEATIYRSKPPIVLVASDVQDPGNIGAMARAAEASGAGGLIAAGASADPWGWKALRGSMGSALRVPIVLDRSVDHAVARARHHGCRIVAAVARGGDSLYTTDLTGPTAVFVGGEGHGLPLPLVDAADLRVTVPMTAPVESLNTAVAAAIILYEARRQRARA